ncbi:DNA -binding domain-containing protein [Allosphingosinicella indica]|uniref:Uncharacterized conserved protein n=1 Tax=Allosphingosinicella indica TaxID=941907 RepID=A0A1X7FYB6_9SPHN|nr:DUF2285 domain-containing protein [Allosphingosinicella indica]SMF61057.1 Uncharacterized conserved protein [Allosphingosinicella indica]
MPPTAPCWQDADAYAHLLGAGRSVFAWEGLRRNAAYRAEFEAGASGMAERWGLVCPAPPSLAFQAAAPLWRREAHPHVLEATVLPACDDPSDHIAPALWSGAAAVHASHGVRHILFTDGLHALRLDLSASRAGPWPVRIGYRIAGLTSAKAPLATLQRWLRFASTGTFTGALFPAEARARRWVLLLRAHDALAFGATQRQIAQHLIARVAPSNWRTEDPALRLRAQRLARDARDFVRTGWRRLL